MVHHPDECMTTEETVEVLHIDDNQGDLELAHMAFAECCPRVTCRDMSDPRAAMDYLARCAIAGSPPPAIVVLDINMPGVNGPAVLTFIRRLPALKEVPVVMLTSTVQTSEVDECLRLGAVEVVTKPVTYEALVQVARKVFSRIHI
jgi:CheY-like chemotaxis protein